jgi:prolyl 4-hydroxylase
MKYQHNLSNFKMKKIDIDTNIFLIEDFFTPQQCDAYILWSEQKGYEDAKVQMHGKQVEMKSIRNNARITFIDEAMAEKIWEQLKPFVTEKLANSVAIGLNEMFRFYKYEPGQRFKKHQDGSYVRNSKEMSYFTFMVYLNDDFEGGSTTFDHHTIAPKKGNALVFYHALRHAGEEVTSGFKYVLRTDIMYRINP